MAKSVKRKFSPEIIAFCDTELRNARENSVLECLRGLDLESVSRPMLVPLAQISRRAGNFDFGLRLLTGVIHSENRLQAAASRDEIVEYAALLSQNGSAREALRWLEKLDGPDVELFRGFCRVSQWEYAEAAAHFAKFLSSDASAYQRLIGQVNYAACVLTDESIAAAIGLAEELRAHRLLGNSLELRAQLRLQESRFSDCQRDLEESARIFKLSGSLDQLFVVKWQAVLAALRDRDTAPLAAFRAEAERRGHWSSVREADLYLLKVKFEQNKFDHLYFGTPFEAYRTRILRELNAQPSSFYVLGRPGAPVYIDINTGRIEGSARFKPGCGFHQILEVFLRDFYAPRRISQLFEDLYPNEYFNIFYSPMRIRQAVLRARRWMRDSALPLEIDFSEAGYRLRIKGDIALEVGVRKASDPKSDPFLRLLAGRYNSGQAFSLKSAEEILQVSPTRATRLIRGMMKRGQVTKLGAGRATKYRLVS